MLAVRAYQLGVMLGGGLLPLLLERRAKAGREDPARWRAQSSQHGAATGGKSHLGACGLRWRNALGIALAG